MHIIWEWWRHQRETFSALLAICAEISRVTGDFPAQRPVARSFDSFFDLGLNKRLSKQSWGWWFETLSHPLWRHCNGYTVHHSLDNNIYILDAIVHVCVPLWFKHNTKTNQNIKLCVCCEFIIWIIFVLCKFCAGPRLNIKTVLSTYGDFHVKDKTAVRTSYL